MIEEKLLYTFIAGVLAGYALMFGSAIPRSEVMMMAGFGLLLLSLAALIIFMLVMLCRGAGRT